jgi:hypothetical protein
MSNTRTLSAALALAAALVAAPALAQTSAAPGGTPSAAAPQSGTAAIGQREVTSTGATVPNPGTDKAGPETPRERNAQERSDRVTRSICNGC